MFKYISCFLLAIITCYNTQGQSPREEINLNEGWVTAMDESDSARFRGFQEESFDNLSSWKHVSVPHNWDQYGGYRRQIQGNIHGFAWYRKSFTYNGTQSDKRFYLFFEGVGSYATVWLNGIKVGYHAGGRTTFTLDVSEAIYTDGRTNILAVRADHPQGIRDLPWVDGGCSTERGFSEGSQPLGIFRPVTLIVKNQLNITPFGVHYWNDETADGTQARIHQTVELQNTSSKERIVQIKTNVLNRDGVNVYSGTDEKAIGKLSLTEVPLTDIYLNAPKLWSVESPYLYTIETEIWERGQLLDKEITSYGVRSIRWPKGIKPLGTNQLLVNGKPVFIHGIAEYEHKLGNSHAFTGEEILARVRDMKASGFNSFRDAHQPHNLRYQDYWDEHGVLLWTQMAAHIWFDTPAFRENFKTLLKDWVKERRNSPSVFLWGLENESTLPEEFARECMDIIRELDPTASIQRLVTTCNGGSGTDWDVPQNWTGTYGGDHNTYGEDLKNQLLVGEFGAWRTLEMHAEPPYLANDKNYSEERFTEIMETKLRLADSVKNEVIGHYHWLWTSHDNPGRVQGGEALRDIDKIGPVNYKGLLTPWGEPTDAYYMFRAHYSDPSDPMLYIASHTWPNRWTAAGKKDNIRIYSNCDEVELFNDLERHSLGVVKDPGHGRSFEFNNVEIKYNVLYAEGKIEGKIVARDTIILLNLPRSPSYLQMVDTSSTLVRGDKDFEYLFRVNAGGPDYIDRYGQHWLADQPYTDLAGWGSVSWADTYEDISSTFASQRRIFDPIKGTSEWPLFQTFRYGQDQLYYKFEVPDGEYRVELYFSEPWAGGGGIKDASGMRLFDVAINGQVQEENLDIWKQAGHDGALKKVYNVHVRDGVIRIDFPRISVGQAIVQAIAVAAKEHKVLTTKPATHFNLKAGREEIPFLKRWMDIGQRYDDASAITFQSLPSFLYGSDYFLASTKTIGLELAFVHPSYLYALSASPVEDYEYTGDSVITSVGDVKRVYRKVLASGEKIILPNLEEGSLFAFQVQSGLQPAFDLKQVVSYKANAVKKTEGTNMVNFQKGKRRQIIDNNGWITFDIKVGVADVYSLTLKYHNSSKEIKKGTIELVNLDGAILKEPQTIELTPTRSGKWNYITTDTGTMINAGTYEVRVRSINAKDIYIDAVDVQ